jgi:CheY-like chemotaxis protein
MEVFGDRFRVNNFIVLEAKNGQEGLDLALAEHPDMILLDISMPVMDGLTMLKELRKDEWGKHAEVIFLTNFTDVERISQAAEVEAVDYLIKEDWQAEDLVNKVKEVLGM